MWSTAGQQTSGPPHKMVRVLVNATVVYVMSATKNAPCWVKAHSLHLQTPPPPPCTPPRWLSIMRAVILLSSFITLQIDKTCIELCRCDVAKATFGLLLLGDACCLTERRQLDSRPSQSTAARQDPSPRHANNAGGTITRRSHTPHSRFGVYVRRDFSSNYPA